MFLRTEGVQRGYEFLVLWKWSAAPFLSSLLSPQKIIAPDPVEWLITKRRSVYRDEIFWKKHLQLGNWCLHIRKRTNGFEYICTMYMEKKYPRGSNRLYEVIKRYIFPQHEILYAGHICFSYECKNLFTVK